MPIITLKKFQQHAVDSAVSVFDAMRKVLDAVAPGDEAARATAIHDNGYLLIEAPTGSGKTLMAGHIVERVSDSDNVVWFWFAPFRGVVDQSAAFLREQFQGLRLRTMTEDRNPIGTRSGDVFVTTWGLVATRVRDRRSVRQSGEQNQSVDDLIVAVREQGFRIGVVVDEAHHTFRGDNQAAIFFRTVLKPEFTILVTATPDDRDLDDLKRRMQIGNIHKVSLSRAEAVGNGDAEGLIKRGVKAVAWRVEEGSDAFVDFERTALRDGTQLHNLLKSELQRAGINLTPLMLVQVDSSKGSLERAREELKKLGFVDAQIATHTADEPDPGLLALANNEHIEVLVFKMAVALGFDAPRAWTLVSMRATQDEDFGVQLVGRILRVHRRLQGKVVPDGLRYGYVLLADISAQRGLDAAGQRINRIKTAYATAAPTTIIYGNGDQVMVQSPEHGTQLVLHPHPPDGAIFQPPPPGVLDQSGQVNPHQLEMFATSWAPAEMRPALAAMLKTKAPAPQVNVYKLREDVPRQFKTQDMPEDHDVTEEEVVEHFIARAEALLEASQAGENVRVLKRTLEIFTQAVQAELSFAPPSRDQMQKQAQCELLKYKTLSAKVLRELLARRLHVMLAEKGFEQANDRAHLHECLNDLLCHRPSLLRDAYKRAVAAKAIVYAAEELPPELNSEMELESSRLNVYGCYPRMGGWERSFAEHLDSDDTGAVLWWHRNEPHKPHSINVLMENGQGFFPDFIIGIKERPTENNGLLADPKEAYTRTKELPKLAADHAAYGKVLILTKDNDQKRWEIATWDPEREKARIAGHFGLLLHMHTKTPLRPCVTGFGRFAGYCLIGRFAALGSGQPTNRGAISIAAGHLIIFPLRKTVTDNGPLTTDTQPPCPTPQPQPPPSTARWTATICSLPRPWRLSKPSTSLSATCMPRAFP